MMGREREGEEEEEEEEEEEFCNHYKDTWNSESRMSHMIMRYPPGGGGGGGG